MTPKSNNKPTIQFTFAKFAVAQGASSVLTVSVDDFDDDPVTVTWTASKGALAAGDQGMPSMTWTAPLTIGDVTITATASDGKGGERMIAETIPVGTRRRNDISGDFTMDLARSPWIIDPDLPSTNFTVNSGGLNGLTIEAGVRVLIGRPDITFRVEGILTVAGQPGQPVVLEPNNRNAGPGWWNGIDAQPNSSVPRLNLSNATISSAKNAVATRLPGSAFIDSCRITESSKAAILFQSTGQLRVKDCTIIGNLHSGVQIDSAKPQWVVIEGCSIAVNGFLDGRQYSEGQAGISINIDDSAGSVPITIMNNEISRNDFPGIRIGDPNHGFHNLAAPIIKNNGIFGNELTKFSNKIQIRLEEGPLPAPPTTRFVDARGNFWGQTYTLPESTLIRLGIWDKEDVEQGPNPNISVRVWVTPWLNTAP